MTLTVSTNTVSEVRQSENVIGSPNAGSFVYDGASDTASTGSTGSGVVEDVFVDFFESIGRATEPTAFDGRSDYDAFVAAGIRPAVCSPVPRTSRPQSRRPTGAAPPESPSTRAITLPVRPRVAVHHG